MAKLSKIVAAHPLQRAPYWNIRFVGTGADGVPLYRVTKDARDLPAAEALKLAFEMFGGHCFHCRTWFPPQRLSGVCSRDHILAVSAGGGPHLHNLVLACPPCNRRKGADDIVWFSPARGSEYLKALDAHLERCLAALSKA